MSAETILADFAVGVTRFELVAIGGEIHTRTQAKEPELLLVVDERGGVVDHTGRIGVIHYEGGAGFNYYERPLQTRVPGGTSLQKAVLTVARRYITRLAPTPIPRLQERPDHERG